jgi:uncharacterized membrane protein YfcA
MLALAAGAPRHLAPGNMPELAALSLSEPRVLWVIFGTAAGGLVRGLTGFGSALVAFPILSLFLGPVLAVPVIVVLDAVLTLPLLPGALRRCRWREVLPLALGAAVAIPLGARLLVTLDGDLLRRATAAMIVVFVAVMACGWRYRGRTRPLVSAGVGALAGAMGGATGLSGPPVVLFWLGGESDASTVRANLIASFGLMTVVTVTSYWLGGLFSRQVLLLAVVLSPVFALALWLGAHGFRFASERFFRWASLLLIGVTALLSLVQ